MKYKYRSFGIAGILLILHFCAIWVATSFHMMTSKTYLQLTHTSLDHLLQWDAQWYAAIGQHGYHIPLVAQQAFRTTGNPVPFVQPLQATAYFPFLPMIVHVFGMIGGLVVVNLAFYFSMVLMVELFQKQLSPVKTILGVSLYALNPTMVYESALYTESFAILFSLLVVYGIQRDDWIGRGIACIAGFLSTLNHELGIFIAVFALRYLRERRIGMMFVYGLSVAMGWISYITYLGLRFGHPLAMFQAEHVWGRMWRFPGVNFAVALWHDRNPNLEMVAILVALLIAHIIYSFKQDLSWRPKSNLKLDSLETALWMTFGLLVGLMTYVETQPLTSVPRLLSGLWPMYTLIWIRDEDRSKRWMVFLLAAFLLFAVLGARLYTHGFMFE